MLGRVAAKTRGAAYPSIAIDAKIEALAGMGQSDQALALAAVALQKVTALHLAGHLYELHQTRASVYEKPSTILLGSHATKTAFMHLPLNEYKVIHLALHGYADSEFPDRSALVFAPQSSPADDGLLQVREIRDLPLNSELVTLSACDTGVGPVGEEGAANIVNAFIEAGAQSVVSTLWEIEDRRTAQLMIAFYRHLSQREGKAEALREAQLELLKSGAPPYYWAGFELDGEPNATLFADSKSTVPLRNGQ